MKERNLILNHQQDGAVTSEGEGSREGSEHIIILHRFISPRPTAEKIAISQSTYP